MPPEHHRRPAPAGGAPQHQPGGMPAGPSMSSTMQALDAQLRLIAQRIKAMENNEQIIGQTLVSHKKKISEIEKAAMEGGTGAKVDSEKIKSDLRAEFQREMASMGSSAQLKVDDYPGGRPASKEGKAEMEALKRKVDSMEQSLSEIKYIVGSLNPMEYVTIEELNQLIEQKLRSREGNI